MAVTWRSAVNLKAVRNNPIVLFLYWLTFPLALAARKLRFTPNQLTLASGAAALIAFYALVAQNLALFFCSWLASFLLDLVDGQVARLTGTVSTYPLDVDHFSDLFKISLILVGFGIYYQSNEIWIFSSAALASLLYFSLLNHHCGPLLLSAVGSFTSPGHQGDSISEPPKTGGINRKITRRFFVGKNGRRQAFFAKGYTVLFTFNAHSLLLFFLIPIDNLVATVSLSYFGFLGAWNSTRLLFKVWKLSRHSL